MDMDSTDIFKLEQPNQKSYDNNTMELMDLNLCDIKMLKSLDQVLALSGGGAPSGLMNGVNGGGAVVDDRSIVGATTPAVANGNCNGSRGSSDSGTGGLLSPLGSKEAVNGGGAEGDENGEHQRSNSRSSSIGLNGGGGDDHDLMDGALEDDDGRSLSGDPDQDCKICK